MTNELAVAEKLLQVEAIRLSPQSPFTWASGWKSPIYCDNRKVLSFPFIRDFIKSEMCNVIFEHFPDAGMLAGVATAGIPWGAMASDQLKLPFVYVRSKPKAHGLGNQIEGFFEAGQEVVVIEDLISTGKSSVEVIDVLKAAGLKVVGLVAIFSYGFEVANQAFAQAEVPFITLSNYDSLIEAAIRRGLIQEADQQLLLNWRQDPSNWGKL